MVTPLEKGEQMHREATNLAKSYILQQCAIIFDELMTKPVPDIDILGKGAEIIQTSVNFLKVTK